MDHRVHTLGIGLTTILALVCVAASNAQVTRELFPDTKDHGRAAVEFRDDHLQVVAAYYYSQENHESRWLLIELAASATRPMSIKREDITLMTPDGRPVRVATQEAFMQDIQRTRLLVQNARPTRHGIGSYFQNYRGAHFQWFVHDLFEDGIVRDFFDLNTHGTAWGDLFFASPTGAWEDGTYSLIVEGDDARAVLPIDLM